MSKLTQKLVVLSWLGVQAIAGCREHGNGESEKGEGEKTPSEAISVMVVGTADPVDPMRGGAAEYRVDGRIIPVGDERTLRAEIQRVRREKAEAKVEVKCVEISAVGHATYGQVEPAMHATRSSYGWRFTLGERSVDAQPGVGVKRLEDFDRIREIRLKLTTAGEGNRDAMVGMNHREVLVRATDSSEKRNQAFEEIRKGIVAGMEAEPKGDPIWAVVVNPQKSVRWNYVFGVIYQAKSAGVNQIVFPVRAEVAP